MKQVRFVAAIFVMAVLLLGCAGSGGSSSSVGVVDPATPRIEAVVLLTSSDIKEAAQSKYTADDLIDPTKVAIGDLVDPLKGGIQDTNNIQTQERVIFQLVNYVGGKRNILPATLWSTNATASGTLASETGVFIAGTQETAAGDTPAVSATYNEVAYASYYRVLPRQVKLNGRVLVEGTDKPVSGVVINFYALTNPSDPSSPVKVVGKVTTSYNGWFKASVPNYVQFMQIDNASMPANFYRQFGFDARRFTSGSDSCRVDLTDAYYGLTLTDGVRSLTELDTETGLPIIEDNTQNGTIYIRPTSLSAVDSDGCFVGLG